MTKYKHIYVKYPMLLMVKCPGESVYTLYAEYQTDLSLTTQLICATKRNVLSDNFWINYIITDIYLFKKKKKFFVTIQFKANISGE